MAKQKVGSGIKLDVTTSTKRIQLLENVSLVV